MEPKEAKIARKIVKFFNTDNLEQIYHTFGRFINKHWDYFRSLDNISLLKVLFYIHSLKKTGDILLANNRINNSQFINFFYSTGEKAIITCDECSGSGSIDCKHCDSTGEVGCDVCDDDGEVATECSECDGTGKKEDGENCDYCGGSGVEYDECENCSGSGNVRCDYCYGTGAEYCDTCDSNGEIETDNDVLINYFVVSWDPKFNKLTQDLIELEKPYGETEDFFFKNNKNFLILNQREETDEKLSDYVEIDKVYPYMIENTNYLSWSSGSLKNLVSPKQFIEK
jgi:hypothetical protein